MSRDFSAGEDNPGLFGSRVPKPPEHYLVAYTDGGSRGNPGPAGYGVVIQDESRRKVAALSEYLGRQTNNFAEYQGLIAALEFAAKHAYKALSVISDSELLVQQVKGNYKVKNPALQDLHARAKELISQLAWFSIGHVLRGGNQEADRLANAAMDKGMGRMNSTPARAPSPASLPDKSVPDKRTEAEGTFSGVVRNGKIELLEGALPEGTQVRVRVKTRE